MHDTWHVGGRTEARGVPASTVEPGYFAPMRVDEFVASCIVEAVMHGIDLTQALGRDSTATPEGIAATAAILDDLLARRTIPGRPAELSDDLETGSWRHLAGPSPATRGRR